MTKRRGVAIDPNETPTVVEGSEVVSREDLVRARNRSSFRRYLRRNPILAYALAARTRRRPDA